MIGTGFLLAKVRLLHEQFQHDLNRFILDVTMPCLILSSVLTSDTAAEMPVKDLILVSLVLTVILPLLAILASRIFHFPGSKELNAFCLMYPNVGFIGFPFMKAVYGNTAVLYTAVINLFFNVSLFSLGKMIMGHGKEKFNWKNLLSPGIIASLLAVVFYVLKVRFPDFITEPLDAIGDMTTPLAMMVIGSVLASYPLKKIVLNGKAYLFTLLSDVCLPLLLWPLLKFCSGDTLVRSIALIIASMPTASGAVMFAQQYHQDEGWAATVVSVTTLLSIATIPLIMHLCLM